MAKERNDNNGSGLPRRVYIDEAGNVTHVETVTDGVTPMNHKEPTNAYGFALALGKQWGPWAIISVALFAWIYHQSQQHDRAVERAHSQFERVIKEDVREPLEKITVEQKITNEQLIKQGERMEQHLRLEERRSR